MMSKPRMWLRSWTFWVWLVSVAALGSASACKDVTIPTIVPPEDDTSTTDTIEGQG